MLVTMKEILDRANEGGYAVAAPNIFSELDARAYVEAAEEMNAPLIFGVGFDAITDAMFVGDMLRKLAQQSKVPIAINLDHGGPKRDVISAIHAGFTSIMVDRSSESYEDNVAQVKELCEIAHLCGVSVEAELGHVGQASQYEVDRDAALTSSEVAKKYIEETGVDCLAVAIGTAHGSYPKGFEPYLDFDRLVEIKKVTGNFPLVLHGSSGTSDEQLEKACRLGINKVNICYDLCNAMATALQAANMEGDNAYDVLAIAKNAAKEKLMHMIKIYGSAGKAWVPENPGLPTKLVTLNEANII